MKTLWAVALLTLCTACVTVTSTVLRDRTASPVLEREVYIYLADDELPEDCERVAILHGSGTQDWTDETDMLNKLREEAGKLGANAVHMQSMEDAGTGERVVAALFGGVTDRDSDALALYCPSRADDP